MIDHGALTDLLVAELATSTGELIGDGLAPDGGGWKKGQPNVDVYRPYSVLVSGGASVRISTLTNSKDWMVSWSLRTYAGSRKQCDWMAQKVREAMESTTKQTFGVDQYKIVDVEWKALGPVSRVDAVDPPIWQVFDQVGLLCMKV